MLKIEVRPQDIKHTTNDLSWHIANDNINIDGFNHYNERIDFRVSTKAFTELVSEIDKAIYLLNQNPIDRAVNALNEIKNIFEREGEQ